MRTYSFWNVQVHETSSVTLLDDVPRELYMSVISISNDPLFFARVKRLKRGA